MAGPKPPHGGNLKISPIAHSPIDLPRTQHTMILSLPARRLQRIALWPLAPCPCEPCVELWTAPARPLTLGRSRTAVSTGLSANAVFQRFLQVDRIARARRGGARRISRRPGQRGADAAVKTKRRSRRRSHKIDRTRGGTQLTCQVYDFARVMWGVRQRATVQPSHAPSACAAAPRVEDHAPAG